MNQITYNVLYDAIINCYKNGYKIEDIIDLARDLDNKEG